MWRLADRQLDELIARGPCEFIGAYAQPFAMLVVADLLGVPEAEHERFRAGFGLSANPGELGRRSERHGDERARMARRLLRHVHRGTPPRAARRRPHRLGARQVPRRIDARRDLGRAHRDVPVRRRPGDDGAPARHVAEVPLGVSRAPGRAPRAPRPHPGVHRGGAAHREPGEGRLPAGPPGGDDRRRRDRARYAGDAARTARPTATPAASSARPSSASTAPTPASTSPSAAASTPVPAVRWRAPRPASASSASSTACATSGCRRSTTARPARAGSTTSRRGCCAASTRSTSSSHRTRRSAPVPSAGVRGPGGDHS